MTTIRIHWRPTNNVSSNHTYEVDPQKTPFLRGNTISPDVFLLSHEGDEVGNGFDVVLANGLVEDADPSKQRGRLEGEVAVDVQIGSPSPMELDGKPGTGTIYQTLLHPTLVSIGDGRGKVLRIGKPTAPGTLPIAYDNEIQRGWSTMSLATQSLVLGKLEAGVPFVFDDSKYASNPDNAKEDRIIQSVWVGSLAYAHGVRVAEVLDAARDYVDQQVDLRPCLYYDKLGLPIGQVRGDIWIDEHGFRKGYHGKWLRESKQGDGPGQAGQLEDLEHLAPKRVNLAAAAGDPVGRLFARFHASAICTRPGVKSVKVQQQARAIGYTLEYLTHAEMVGALDEIEAQQMVRNVLEGTHLSRGVGVAGIPFFGCWPVATTHTTHVSLNEAQPDGSGAKLSLHDAKGYFEWRGLEWPSMWDETYIPTAGDVLQWLKKLESEGEAEGLWDPGDLTIGAEGIQTLLNGVACWGIAIAARGMAAVARRWPNLDQKGLLEDAAEFLIERACTVGIDKEGQQISAQMVFDSVAPRCWRVRQANVINGGTNRWCVPGFMDLAEMLEFLAPYTQTSKNQDRAAQLRAAARRVWEHAPDLDLADKGIASIETAGLLALARFGG